MTVDWRYALLLLAGVFISAISQVLLKKSAQKTYDSPIKEYLNPLVICAYTLFVGTTFLSILAYRGIPLAMGPILEATSYIYVTLFGILVFHEKMSKMKWVSLALIVFGIGLFSFGAA